MRNNTSISLNGEIALEVMEPEEFENHAWLLEAVNGKRYSIRYIRKAVELYRARRSDCYEYEDKKAQKKQSAESNGSDANSHPTADRPTALRELILSTARGIGLEFAVLNHLEGRRKLRPLEIEFLRTALERSGYPKEFFIFD